MDRETVAGHVEGVASATAVFALGVAVGMTWLAAHAGPVDCVTVGGEAFSERCQMLAWGEARAYDAVRVAVGSFVVAFTAARHDVVGAWWDERGDGA